MRHLLNILFFCLLAGFAGVALAQTPDGDPPAVETICNDLNFSGASFGLCNAYCEAMDCDCPTNGDPENPNCLPNASQKACDRVLANFYKKEPDVILVCEQEPEVFYALEVAVMGEGDVLSDLVGTMTGIDCPDFGCEDTYSDGTVVTLEAFADDGWSFDGWGGDCAGAGTSPTVMVTMDQNHTCTATFSEDVMEEDCPCDGFGGGWVDPGFIAANWDLWVGGGPFSTTTTCTDDGLTITLTETSPDFPGIIDSGSVEYANVLKCEVKGADFIGLQNTATWAGLTAGQALGCRNDLLASWQMFNPGASCPPAVP